MDKPKPVFGSCPLPGVEEERVLIGHGSGGRLAQRLLQEVIYPEFSSPALDRRDDQAVLSVPAGRVAFSTDSFVVTPLFFPGGDIGRLAVHGTVNDLAMSGAHPKWISVSFILEEGLLLSTLRAVVRSLGAAARECGVQIVTGDTKVVGAGSADQLFVNTSGIGLIPDGVDLSGNQVQPGDRLLLSGPIADHGMAVMMARDGLGFEGAIESDTAPLHGLVEALLASGAQLRCMRDPTRGGLAATVTEIAQASGVDIELDESRVPVREPVRSACELLGIDPLHVACEGRLVAFVSPRTAEQALAAARAHPSGENAVLAGVARAGAGQVRIRTAIGGMKILYLPLADPLPRIC